MIEMCVGYLSLKHLEYDKLRTSTFINRLKNKVRLQKNIQNAINGSFQFKNNHPV